MTDRNHASKVVAALNPEVEEAVAKRAAELRIQHHARERLAS